MTSRNNGNGTRSPVITKKEAEENMDMSPSDVQRRMAEDLEKLRK